MKSYKKNIIVGGSIGFLYYRPGYESHVYAIGQCPISNGIEPRACAFLLQVRICAPASIFPVLSERVCAPQVVLKEGQSFLNFLSSPLVSVFLGRYRHTLKRGLEGFRDAARVSLFAF